MPVERRVLALALLVAAAPATAGEEPAVPARDPVRDAALDPALLEFLGEFSVDDGFVDPIALDGTQHPTLDRKERAAARRARTQTQTAPAEVPQEKTR